MLNPIRIVLFRELNPCRAAGGHQWEGASAFYSADKLCCLLQNREVSSEVRVKDLVETESLQSGYQLSFEVRARIHAESLGYTDSNRRSYLSHYMSVRIGQRVVNQTGVIALYKGGRGANPRALSAIHTLRLAYSGAESHTDNGFKATL